jgi:hypothetical protein
MDLYNVGDIQPCDFRLPNNQSRSEPMMVPKKEFQPFNLAVPNNQSRSEPMMVSKEKFQPFNLAVPNNELDVSPFINGENFIKIILFTTIWCPHSKKAIIEWDHFVNKMSRTLINGYLVKCEQIDCTTCNDAIEIYRLEKFPSLRIWKNEDTLFFDDTQKITCDSLEKVVNSIQPDINLGRVSESGALYRCCVSEKDALLSKEDVLLSKEDVLLSEKDALLSKEDVLLSEKDALLLEKDALLSKKDALLETQSTLKKKQKKPERKNNKNKININYITTNSITMLF